MGHNVVIAEGNKWVFLGSHWCKLQPARRVQLTIGMGNTTTNHWIGSEWHILWQHTDDIIRHWSQIYRQIDRNRQIYGYENTHLDLTGDEPSDQPCAKHLMTSVQTSRTAFTSGTVASLIALYKDSDYTRVPAGDYCKPGGLAKMSLSYRLSEHLGPTSHIFCLSQALFIGSC